MQCLQLSYNYMDSINYKLREQILKRIRILSVTKCI